MKANKNTYPLVVVIFCILTRLPQLFSAELFIDSDEAVVGLMTKHLLAGQDFPLYFWGQRYGLSIIEELFILPFFIFTGTSVIGVKLGMLLLWTLGVLLFYKVLAKVFSDNRKMALLLTLLFIAAPAWGVWSMKARGGYLTSFALCNLTLLLLFTPHFVAKKYSFIIIAILSFLSFESQPFFLSGVLPIIFYTLVKERKAHHPILFAITAGTLWLLSSYYKSDLYNFYNARTATVTLSNLYEQIGRIPEYLYISLTGTYHFSWSFKPDFFNAIFAVIFSAAIFVVLILALVELKNYKKSMFLFYCSVGFLPITFAYSLFTYETDYRYMLPVVAYLILALSIYFSHHPINKTSLRVIVVLILIGSAGMISLHKWQFQRVSKTHILKTIQLLDEYNIKYLYCTDYNFNWDIMFHSDERIKARNFYFPHRYPEYDTLVDNAYMSGQPTAVFGNSDRRFGLHFDSYIMDDVYYLSLNPPKEKLEPVFAFKPE